MSTFTNTEYWEEISNIAIEVSDQAKEEQRDLSEVIHEWLDNHEWVIYYGNNLSVLEHCDVPDFMINELGGESAGQVLAESGLNGLHAALAYWAMYADVMDHDDLTDWEMEE